MRVSRTFSRSTATFDGLLMGGSVEIVDILIVPGQSIPVTLAKDGLMERVVQNLNDECWCAMQLKPHGF